MRGNGVMRGVAASGAAESGVDAAKPATWASAADTRSATFPVAAKTIARKRNAAAETLAIVFDTFPSCVPSELSRWATPKLAPFGERHYA
jgi:hypothetical protein